MPWYDDITNLLGNPTFQMAAGIPLAGFGAYELARGRPGGALLGTLGGLGTYFGEQGIQKQRDTLQKRKEVLGQIKLLGQRPEFKGSKGFLEQVANLAGGQDMGDVQAAEDQLKAFQQFTEKQAEAKPPKEGAPGLLNISADIISGKQGGGWGALQGKDQQMQALALYQKTVGQGEQQKADIGLNKFLKENAVREQNWQTNESIRADARNRALMTAIFAKDNQADKRAQQAAKQHQAVYGQTIFKSAKDLGKEAIEIESKLKDPKFDQQARSSMVDTYNKRVDALQEEVNNAIGVDPMLGISSLPINFKYPKPKKLQVGPETGGVAGYFKSPGAVSTTGGVESLEP